jgi:hypothetical protein
MPFIAILPASTHERTKKKLATRLQAARGAQTLP